MATHIHKEEYIIGCQTWRWSPQTRIVHYLSTGSFWRESHNFLHNQKWIKVKTKSKKFRKHKYFFSTNLANLLSDINKDSSEFFHYVSSLNPCATNNQYTTITEHTCPSYWITVLNPTWSTGGVGARYASTETEPGVYTKTFLVLRSFFE